MKKEDFIDLSKRMVVEYYNRYVHNIEPDMADIEINKDFIEITEESYDSDGMMTLSLRVYIDVWIEYHVEYNPNSKDKISSYVTLS